MGDVLETSCAWHGVVLGTTWVMSWLRRGADIGVLAPATIAAPPQGGGRDDRDDSTTRHRLLGQLTGSA